MKSKKEIKNILLIFLILSLSASLAGCGGASKKAGELRSAQELMQSGQSDKKDEEKKTEEKRYKYIELPDLKKENGEGEIPTAENDGSGQGNTEKPTPSKEELQKILQEQENSAAPMQQPEEQNAQVPPEHTGNSGPENNGETPEKQNEEPENGDKAGDNTQDETPAAKSAAQARADFIRYSNPYVDEATAMEYALLFEKYASARSYIDAEMLMAIARIESVYYYDAVAEDGSGRYLGLMQLHEYYESAYGYAEGQLFDPACNIECACRLLDDCAYYYNYDLVLTVQAYHLGPIAVDDQLAQGALNTYYFDLASGFADEIRNMYQ